VTKKVKITILFPVYNKQKYISQALNSILMQKTDFLYKIIIIDDSSTDNSVKIIKKFIKKYPEKIDFIQNIKNLRCLATSLKGYELIKTEYFCVLDPDDYWIDNNKLQKAIDFLDKHQRFTIFVSNNYIEEKQKLTPYFNFKSKDFDFKNLDNAVYGHTSGTVFRNVLFPNKIPEIAYKSINTPDEKVYEGDSFRNIIHLKAGKGHFENSIESVYRITKTGIWTSLDTFHKNSLNARFFLKMFFLFNKKKYYFIKTCWNYCLINIDILSKVDSNISNIDLFQFKDILIKCIKNIKPELKYSNLTKLTFYSVLYNLQKSRTSQIEIINKIKKISENV
jgi:glycosyltransferase involved in cell wall biosynthesis